MLLTKFKPWWHFLNMSSKSRKFVTEIIGDWHLLPKLICCPTINVGSCWISLKLEFWKKSKSKVNWPFARLKSCSRVELETVLSLVGFQTDSDWSVLLSNQRSSWNQPFINGVNCGIFALKFPFDIRDGYNQIIDSTSLDFHLVLKYVIITPSLRNHLKRSLINLQCKRSDFLRNSRSFHILLIRRSSWPPGHFLLA